MHQRHCPMSYSSVYRQVKWPKKHTSYSIMSIIQLLCSRFKSRHRCSGRNRGGCASFCRTCGNWSGDSHPAHLLLQTSTHKILQEDGEWRTRESKLWRCGSWSTHHQSQSNNCSGTKGLWGASVIHKQLSTAARATRYFCTATAWDTNTKVHKHSWSKLTHRERWLFLRHCWASSTSACSPSKVVRLILSSVQQGEFGSTYSCCCWVRWTNIKLYFNGSTLVN